MNRSDPLAHADVLASYGRTKEAVEILRDAIRRNPSRPDLRVRLEELTTKRTLPWRDRIKVGIHLAMVWVLLLGCAAIVFGSAIGLGKALESQIDALAARWDMIWFLACLLITLVVLAIAWVYLFLALWFGYLKALPDDVRRKVEDRLPWALNVVAFGTSYIRVRRLFFRDNDA